MNKPVLDLGAYNKAQLATIFLCPVNRHATREEHGWCSDQDLFEHPEWLIDHFTKNGGATAFAKRREEFTHLCEEIERCIHGDNCELGKRHGASIHCPIKKNGEKCMKCSGAKKVDE